MKIKGIVALEECEQCQGAKRITGEHSVDGDGLIDCPMCKGVGTTKIGISLGQLKALLKLV